MSGEISDEKLRALFTGLWRLKEDLERLGGDVKLNASLVLSLDDVEDYSWKVDGAWVEALDKAAAEIADDPGRGWFMRLMAETWLAADPANKVILGPAWQRLVSRDGLGRFMEGG